MDELPDMRPRAPRATRLGAPFTAVLTAVLAAVLAVAGLGVILAPGAAASAATERAAAAVLGGASVSARDRSCVAQALGSSGPRTLDALALAADLDTLAPSLQNAAYAALRRCPEALGAVVAAGASADGIELTRQDASCLGRALAGLSPATLTSIATQDFGDMSNATGLAVFSAFKKCPTALGTIFVHELAQDGLDATPASARCLGVAFAKRLTAAQLVDLARQGVDGAMARGSMIAVFTAFKDCPDVVGPMMAKELEGDLTMGALTREDTTCLGRAMILGLTPSELYEISTGGGSPAVQVRIMAVLGTCRHALVAILTAGFRQAMPLLTETEGACIGNGLLDAFTAEEIGKASLGQASPTLTSRFRSTMAALMKGCAPTRAQ